MLSKIVAKNDGPLDPAGLRSVRARVKAMTDTDAVKNAVEFIAHRFLHRPPSFIFDALLEHVRSSLARMALDGLGKSHKPET